MPGMYVIWLSKSRGAPGVCAVEVIKVDNAAAVFVVHPLIQAVVAERVHCPVAILDGERLAVVIHGESDRRDAVQLDGVGVAIGVS